MTGIYVRVKRAGKWQALEIERLTEPELTEFFKEQTKERVIMFLAALTAWMRDNLKSV